MLIINYVSNKENSLYSFDVSNIIDTNNDGVYEIVASKSDFDGMSYCTQIYKIIDGEFKALNECEIVSY